MFDEAHFSVPRTHIPLGAQSLQRTGYSNEVDTESNQPVLIKLLSDSAIAPSLSTPQSIGMDLSSASAIDITIPPHGGTASIITDIAMEPPDGTYVRIA